MRNWILLVICLISMMGCRTVRQPVKSIVIDSVSYELRDVEKTVHIQGDTVKMNMQVQLKKDDNGSLDCNDDNRFIPQSQTIETKDSKVQIEITSRGEVKAKAIVKDRDEKVTVQEKTVSKNKSELIIVEQKDSWLKRFLKGLKRNFNTVLFTLPILLGLYAFFRYRSVIISFIGKLFNKKS